MIGDVAQRVERLLRMQEAGGSNPPISTTNLLLVASRSQEKVGAHQKQRGFEADPSASSGGKVSEANVSEGGRLRRKSVSDGGEGIPPSPPQLVSRCSYSSRLLHYWLTKAG